MANPEGYNLEELQEYWDTLNSIQREEFIKILETDMGLRHIHENYPWADEGYPYGKHHVPKIKDSRTAITMISMRITRKMNPKIVDTYNHYHDKMKELLTNTTLPRIHELKDIQEMKNKYL